MVLSFPHTISPCHGHGRVQPNKEDSKSLEVAVLPATLCKIAGSWPTGGLAHSVCCPCVSMAFQELDPYGEEYELHWLATVLVSLFALGLSLLARLMGRDKKLAYDMMQHAAEEDTPVSDLKDGVRNVWQQISTVAALIFPATIAALQEAGEVKPFYYESSAGTDDDGSGERVVIHLQQAYLASTIFALMWSGYGCSYSLLNFAYIECLSQRQALAFFLSQPAALSYGFAKPFNSCVLLAIYGRLVPVPTELPLGS
ncbi:unnamed protein product [Symbiodinium microadriaticum]|nr:unnamed protein product [Symbiodinium microadriaticum]